MSETDSDLDPIPFEKYHGTGNDFVVVDASDRVPNRRAFAERVCDRTSGIGADGVLFLALETETRTPRVVMTLFQPDGSTAPMCGNGARCAAAWAMERTGTERVMVDTQAGSRRAERAGEEIAIEMGRPSFAPADVPIDADGPVVERAVEELGVTDDTAIIGTDHEGERTRPEDWAGLTVTAVDTGVPHTVVLVEDVDSIALEAVAPPIRHADAFPRGTNVTLASPADGGFRQRTYERGVEGETDACGTGAVAVAAVARRLGLTDVDAVTVRPPGGELRVSWTPSDRALLEGAVVREFGDEISVAESW
ncbi:diaminopimelate epimerase [Halovivax sp.]|uniref:diaminopimelate epimerase n=1 Tax=Halovivax sp. TaxID=1935978 RepID=UPI0025C39FDF|nr:diaminopimelate epimerase [Halovivax sp.]